MQVDPKVFNSEIKFVVGVDEVGRGALAGQMFAGAVGFNRSHLAKIQATAWSKEINDSKKLSDKKRHILAQAIREYLPYALGQVSVAEINYWGLTRANQIAIRRAMEKLPKAKLIISDGNLAVPRSFAEYQSVIKADQTIWLVAAASIIAKTARDNLMKIEFHSLYPEYGFDQHVGYGTKLHRDKIRQYGLSPIHRKNFMIKI